MENVIIIMEIMEEFGVYYGFYINKIKLRLIFLFKMKYFLRRVIVEVLGTYGFILMGSYVGVFIILNRLRISDYLG